MALITEEVKKTLVKKGLLSSNETVREICDVCFKPIRSTMSYVSCDGHSICCSKACRVTADEKFANLQIDSDEGSTNSNSKKKEKGKVKMKYAKVNTKSKKSEEDNDEDEDEEETSNNNNNNEDDEEEEEDEEEEKPKKKAKKAKKAKKSKSEDDDEDEEEEKPKKKAKKAKDEEEDDRTPGNPYRSGGAMSEAFEAAVEGTTIKALDKIAKKHELGNAGRLRRFLKKGRKNATTWKYKEDEDGNIKVSKIVKGEAEEKPKKAGKKAKAEKSDKKAGKKAKAEKSDKKAGKKAGKKKAKK